MFLNWFECFPERRNQRFSDVSREFRNETLGSNGLIDIFDNFE